MAKRVRSKDRAWSRVSTPCDPAIVCGDRNQDASLGEGHKGEDDREFLELSWSSAGSSRALHTGVNVANTDVSRVTNRSVNQEASQMSCGETVRIRAGIFWWLE